MRHNSVLAAVVMMMMALWMTTGFAHAAEAETCEGYENKEEVSEGGGSGTFTVTAAGDNIGSITWNNDAEPENVTWDVQAGFSLDVCVKGGPATATGSGQTGTLTPPGNEGGETPAVSHFAWSVTGSAASEENGEENGQNGEENGEENGQNGTVVPGEGGDEEQDAAAGGDDEEAAGAGGEGDEAADEGAGGDDDAQVADAGDDADVQVADAGDADAPVADVGGDTGSQVAQVPEGAVSAGGGSTAGVENARLFAVGLVLIAAAGPVLVLARRASRSAQLP